MMDVWLRLSGTDIHTALQFAVLALALGLRRFVLGKQAGCPMLLACRFTSSHPRRIRP
jgi:hypothetical protein